MPTVTISLPESLKQFLEHEVATKGYGDVSEYVCGLIRQAQTRETDARLEGLLLEGLASGEEMPLTPEFWTKLKAEAETSKQHPNEPAKTGAPQIAQ